MAVGDHSSDAEPKMSLKGIAVSKSGIVCKAAPPAPAPPANVLDENVARDENVSLECTTPTGENKSSAPPPQVPEQSAQTTSLDTPIAPPPADRPVSPAKAKPPPPPLSIMIGGRKGSSKGSAAADGAASKKSSSQKKRTSSSSQRNKRTSIGGKPQSVKKHTNATKHRAVDKVMKSLKHNLKHCSRVKSEEQLFADILRRFDDSYRLDTNDVIDRYRSHDAKCNHAHDIVARLLMAPQNQHFSSSPNPVYHFPRVDRCLQRITVDHHVDHYRELRRILLRNGRVSALPMGQRQPQFSQFRWDFPNWEYRQALVDRGLDNWVKRAKFPHTPTPYVWARAIISTRPAPHILFV